MQKQVVAGDAEAAWEFGLQTRHASLQLIHLLAIAAEEVMVVLFAGNLIARRLAGKLDCNDPAFVSQILEVAIDGRDTEILDAAFRVGENLIRRKRTICFNEGSANRILLTGVTCRDFGLRFHDKLSFCCESGGGRTGSRRIRSSECPRGAWYTLKSCGDSLTAGRAAPAGTLARCAAKHQTQKEWCVSRGRWLWLAPAVMKKNKGKA